VDGCSKIWSESCRRTACGLVAAELNDQNQMELEMKVAGDTRPSVELVHRMEDSKHFQEPTGAGGAGLGGGAGVSASVISIYVPDSTDRAEIVPDLGNCAQVENRDWAMLAAMWWPRDSVLASGRLGEFTNPRNQRTAAN